MGFKVGDRVKVVGLTGPDRDYTDLKIGDTGIVKSLCDDNDDVVEISFDRNIRHNKYNWNPVQKTYQMFLDQLELVKTEPIVIYRKGNEVIALDKSTNKKGIAKCSPQDEFDFYMGAALAFGRLVDESKYLNTSIVITNNGNSQLLTVGKIYEIKGGRFVADDGRTYPLYNPLIDIEDLNGYFAHEGYKRRDGSDFTRDTVEYVEIKEVNRSARIGEYVKVLSEDGHCCKKGQIYRVENTGFIPGWVRVDALTPSNMLRRDQYVVVEEIIGIGDKVTVIQNGLTHDLYNAWPGLKGYESHFVRNRLPKVGKEYIVLNIENHGKEGNCKLALIQDPDTTQVFIINIKGIRKCQ